jgi:RNA polymerase sigma factor FliA
MASTEKCSKAERDGDDHRALWQDYASRRDPAVRAQLVECYLGLAKRLAGSLYAQRPDNSVDFADYVQYARVGLLEAVDRFDPAREVRFETFASYRIRGSILNGLPKTSEHAAQREYRREIVHERVESMRSAAESGRDPFEELVEITVGLALGYILEDSDLHSQPDERVDSDPYQVCELRRVQGSLNLVVGALPPREREIIRLHYLEQMDFTAIAADMGLSKGRISQLHSRALRLIREAYRAYSRFDVSC